MTSDSSYRQQKAVCILLFTLISISILLFRTHPATHYEISIFEYTPKLGFATIFAATTILSLLFYYKYNYYNNIIFWGVLIFSYFILFGLPFFRGYYFYGNADPLTHIGIIKTISNTHSVPEGLVYPTLHLYVITLSRFTGSSILNIGKLLPPYFGVLFFIFIFVYIRDLLQVDGRVLMVLSIPAFGHSVFTDLIPFGLSLIVLPSVLFAHQRYTQSPRTYNWAGTLLLFTIFLIFTHPISAVIYLLYLFLDFISTYGLNKFGNADLKPRSLTLLLIASVPFTIWFIYSEIWLSVAISLANWFSQEGSTVSSSISSTLDKLGLSLIEKLSLFLTMYGTKVFIFFLFTLGALTYTRKFIKSNINSYRLAPCIVTVTGLVSMFLLSFTLGSLNLPVLRLLEYVVIFSLPVAGYFLLKMESQSRINISNGIGLIIPIIIMIAFASIFPSPIVYQPTPHVTHAHSDGASWFFLQNSNEIPAAKLQSAAPWRLGEMNFGANQQRKYPKMKKATWETMPDHFGSNSKDIPNRKLTYFVSDRSTKEPYFTIWKNTDRYSRSDFNSLDNSAGTAKIYSNGDYTVRLLSSPS